MKNQELVGIFSNEREAVEVIKGLKAMGYLDDEISVIAKSSCRLNGIEEIDVELTSVKIDHEKLADTLDSPIPVAPAGIQGNSEDALVGLGYGLLAIPGAESFSAKGPVAGTFGATGVNDPLDRIARALVDIGINKKDADKYKSYIDRCDVIVAVEERSELEKNQVLKYYKDNNSLV